MRYSELKTIYRKWQNCIDRLTEQSQKLQAELDIYYLLASRKLFAGREFDISSKLPEPNLSGTQSSTRTSRIACWRTLRTNKTEKD